MEEKKHYGSFYGLFIILFFSLYSWLCSTPAWVTLILHFVIDLPLYWFWISLGVWLLCGILRYLVIVFARWGAAESRTVTNENVNPYSATNKTYPTAGNQK